MQEYTTVLNEIKKKVQQAQVKTVIAANKHMLFLYWDMGNYILRHQHEKGWGAKIISLLEADLKKAFPAVKGFSSRNLLYMKQFAEAYPLSILEAFNQLGEELSEGKTFSYDWIKKLILTEKQSVIITQQPVAQLEENTFLKSVVSKVPWSHHVILLNKLTDPGKGFAFIGKQVHIEIGGQDFYIDLLLYHIRLHAYVVVELKARDFQPEDTGKLNFYINVVNDKMKGPGDSDTIGMLLCKGKNEVMAEYALKGIGHPIGVAEYQLAKAIPAELKSQLPDISDLENELSEEK